MKNQRIINLRAFAILMVVFGHSIILYSSEWNLYTTTIECIPLDVIKRIINLIQMPLYFSISGYLFFYSQSKNKNYIAFIIDKAKRLLIPFITFALIWLLPIRLLLHYPPYKNHSPFSLIFIKILWGKDNGHLWFLQALFVIFVVMFFICRILYEKNSILLYIGVALLLVVISLSSNKLLIIPILHNFSKYCFWFYIGFMYNKFEDSISNKYIKILSCILAVLSFILYTISTNILLQYILVINMIVILYNFTFDKSFAILDRISSNSFGIYLFHSPLIYITFTYWANTMPFIVVFINFILWGGLSYLLTTLIKKTKIKIIIGE